MTEDCPVRRRTAADDRPARRPAAGTRQAFLPSEVDPTVFDEAFLRQLERLLLLMRSPVRGGLKGGRRSVKRGQSVEFADYRDYTARRRPAPARLERLRPARDACSSSSSSRRRTSPSPSSSMPRRRWRRGSRPSCCSRSERRRRSATSGSRARTGSRSTALAGRTARRRTALRGSGRVFRLLADLSAIEPADGPTDLLAAARHAAAQLHGRGVVILLSDLLDPAADRVIRELAATGSELIVLHILSPDELDPPLEGDLRLVDSETGDGIDVTVDLATIDAYKARLAAWKAGFADLAAKRRASYVDLSSDVNLADLMFAELRRRRVLG